MRLAATLALADLLVGSCKDPPPIAEQSPRTDVDCQVIREPSVCNETPGCKFRMVYICVPLWRLQQAKWDPIGVQNDLINRRRAELRAIASGRIGCFPKLPPSKAQTSPPRPDFSCATGKHKRGCPD